MNDLVAGGSGPSRELAKYALNEPQWESAQAIAKFGGEQLQATRAALNDQLVPLAKAEPGLNGPEAESIRKHLRLIGCKVRPDFSADQAEAWLGSVLVALSNLPTKCLFRASYDALHIPFQFPNEAEAKIRELAEAERERQQRAIRRLDAMQRELQGMRSPALPNGTREPLSTAEVHELQRSPMGKELVRLGLAMGEIQPEQLLTPDQLATEGNTHEQR
jgi:hypothetical protein